MMDGEREGHVGRGKRGMMDGERGMINGEREA